MMFHALGVAHVEQELPLAGHVEHQSFGPIPAGLAQRLDAVTAEKVAQIAAADR